MSGEDNNPFENEIKPSANGYYDFTYTMDTISFKLLNISIDTPC